MLSLTQWRERIKQAEWAHYSDSAYHGTWQRLLRVEVERDAALEALEEAQGGWNAAAAELARHDCNVGEFGCSAPDSKGPCTKHQLAEAQGRIGAIREAAELAPEVAIATILAILGESE